MQSTIKWEIAMAVTRIKGPMKYRTLLSSLALREQDPLAAGLLDGILVPGVAQWKCCAHGVDGSSCSLSIVKINCFTFIYSDPGHFVFPLPKKAKSWLWQEFQRLGKQAKKETYLYY